MPTIRDWEDYSDEAQEQIIREKTNRKLKNIQKKEKQKNENKYTKLYSQTHTCCTQSELKVRHGHAGPTFFEKIVHRKLRLMIQRHNDGLPHVVIVMYVRNDVVVNLQK